MAKKVQKEKLSNIKLDAVLASMGLNVDDLDAAVDAAADRVPFTKGKDGKDTTTRGDLTDQQYHSIAERWFSSGRVDGFLNLLKALVVDKNA